MTCNGNNYINQVIDVGFLPLYHGQHETNQAAKYEYECLGEEFRKDEFYETDDAYACDRELQSVISKYDDLDFGLIGK